MKLIGPVGIRLKTQLSSRFHHIHDYLFCNAAAVVWHQRQLRAVSEHVIELLLAKSSRTYDVNRISLGRAHQREGSACAAAGVFDYRTARPQAAVLFGASNDAQRHAVFHASR